MSINIFMKQRDIKPDLQRNVRQALEHTYKSKRNIEHLDKVDKIINKLPASISDLLQRAVNVQQLEKSKFFKTNFSAETLEKLSLKMKEVSYLPNEVIMHAHDHQEQFFYIISQGTSNEILLQLTIF